MPTTQERPQHTLPEFIPFHVTQKIANEVRLGSHVTRSGTIEILQMLGYSVEEEALHDFHERNLSSNYREFPPQEIAEYAKKVLDKIGEGVKLTSSPTTEAVLILNPPPCMPPNVIGETAGLEVSCFPGNQLEMPFGDGPI